MCHSSDRIGSGAIQHGVIDVSSVVERLDPPMNVDQEQPAGISAPVDYSAALLWVDGDRALLTELVEIFLEDCPRRLHELEQAVTDGNAIMIKQSAHSLKGMVACFGAKLAQERAAEMEGLGKAGDVTNTSALLPQLQLEFARVMNCLMGADWRGMN
ncbi:MAG: Hpt domain-containing protein [Nitrospira sp.]|nr:MAG: Hpt domain-containing protein [Nitrospira sp.]